MTNSRSSRRLAPVYGPAEIETFMTMAGREPGGGLIAGGDALTFAHRGLIVALAARFRLPAIYADRAFPTVGGLMSYGTDRRSQFQAAATYVNRILRGEKPADLPVQQPTKFELVINMKTAKDGAIHGPAGQDGGEEALAVDATRC